MRKKHFNWKERDERIRLAAKYLGASHRVTMDIMGNSMEWLFLGLLLIVALVLLTSCTTQGAPTQDLYSSASSNQMTANAAQLLAQYQKDSLTATSQAPIVHITETAAAQIISDTQAASTDVAAQRTQIAGSTQTAESWTPTPSQTPSITPTSTPNATTTLAFAVLGAQQTQIANDTQKSTYLNDFYSILPELLFIALACISALGLIWIGRREQFIPAKVDARGNVLPMLNVVDGTYTDMDRNPNHRGDLKDAFMRDLAHFLAQKYLGMAPTLPQITAPRQDATTERDQMIDLATRGLIPDTSSQARERKQEAGQQSMKLLTGPTLTSRFKMVDDPNQLDVIDTEVMQVLDHEWKEGTKS